MKENNPNIRLTKQYFNLLAERKLEEIMGLIAEDICWNIPGNQEYAPWTGQRNTRSEVRKFFMDLWQNTQPIDGKIFHHAACEDVVISSGQLQSKMLLTGKVYCSLFFTEVIFDKGLITKYTLLEDSNALVEALTPSDEHHLNV